MTRGIIVKHLLDVHDSYDRAIVIAFRIGEAPDAIKRLHAHRCAVAEAAVIVSGIPQARIDDLVKSPELVTRQAKN